MHAHCILPPPRPVGPVVRLAGRPQTHRAVLKRVLGYEELSYHTQDKVGQIKVITDSEIPPSLFIHDAYLIVVDSPGIAFQASFYSVCPNDGNVWLFAELKQRIDSGIPEEKGVYLRMGFGRRRLDLHTP